MLKDRDTHGIKSAELLFGENPFGFDFGTINHEDRVKIGLLCIKHFKDWCVVSGFMKTILEENNLPVDILADLFEEPNIPVWALDFSGRLISASDFLRYRGRELKNDLKEPFSLWSQCSTCKTMYSTSRDFCSEKNCNSSELESIVVVGHDFEDSGTNPKDYSEWSIYHISEDGKCSRIEETIDQGFAYVKVRDDNQLYTRGDMSLFDVQVSPFRTWYNERIDLEVDCGELDDYATDEEGLINAEYKTAVYVKLDAANMDAAIFTLSTYITKYLHRNISVEFDSTLYYILPNNTILHISMSDGSIFSEYFREAWEKGNLDDKVHEAMQSVDDIFKKWKELYDIVLPVEVIDNRVEVISL